MKREHPALVAVALAWCIALLATVDATPPQLPGNQRSPSAAHAALSMFAPATDCLACHNNLISPVGEDVSIGASWRGSMMAQSARDPYVLASVRREVVDHPSLAREIENECAACHVPAGQRIAHALGETGRVLSHQPSGVFADERAVVAGDGVSCTVCHQMSPERLGTSASFNGHFVLAEPRAPGRRRAFGALEPDAGRRRIMHSVTGFEQEQSNHVKQSELCASCHTLITTAYGPRGEIIGSLPEQMNYQEWRHSAFFAEQRSCQSCHMPKIGGPVRVASVLGPDRPSLARHTFLGGNAFMLRLMNRFRDELGIDATSAELEQTARATTRQLETETALLNIERASIAAGILELDIAVQNVTGHKLPTGYPSRRLWIHVVVRDRQGQITFESGRVNDTGFIEGNANDTSAVAFEPHYEEITAADQVQIYESVMGTPTGTPTTGLLQATQYLKDNRLLPRGFEKQTAPAEIAVRGNASADPNFIGGTDRIRYRIPAIGSVTADVELRYQPIAYRWAQNLKPYDAPEPQAFTRYFNAVSASSSVVVARASASIGP